jgi:hypothetical protein
MASEFQEPEWLFPFEALGIGDSFFVPTLQPAPMTYIIDTRAKAAKCKVRTDIRVENDCLGVRVWRIR